MVDQFSSFHIGDNKILNLLAGILFVFNVLSGSCNKSPLMSDDEVFNDIVMIAPGIPVGTISHPNLSEVSGMVMSSQDNKLIWVHNDSGDGTRLYLIDHKAEYKFHCTIEGANNRDWEDISVYNNKLYIGDIGDNIGIRSLYTIYIIDEPSVKSKDDITVKQFKTIQYKYPDGARDAETLMTDPLNGDIYIVSKREENVNVYRIAFPYNFNDTTIAEKVMTLPFSYFVGGDISRDGKEIVMKTYQNIYYWPRKNGKTIKEAFSEVPQEIPYKQEPQGEAICWSTDAKSFYTLSEQSPLKITPVLYRFDKQ